MRAPVAILAASWVAGGGALALAQEGEITRHVHLGAASCASSVCHGKIAPQPGRNVALNEYSIWAKEDLHSRAYRVLEGPVSKRIAANLGLGNPTGEKICLDCHADHVPQAKRGPKFQLSDGVSCEACHGGAEKWIEYHSQASRTHRENVAQGMFPSALPVPRARLCISCHVGTRNKFATHAIMAAGHPRLSFELEAYTTNQPAHFVVDADYKQRKGTIAGMNLWLTGQIESARTLLSLQQSELFHPAAITPELALYDCHSCHHPMDRLGATKRPAASAGNKPGGLRLQTQNLYVLAAVLEKLDPKAQGELVNLTGALVKAGQRDVGAVGAAAGALLEWLKGHEALGQRSFSRAEIVEARKALIQRVAAESFVDYAVAEQIVLGVESLSYAIGDRNAKKGQLDGLYAAVKDGVRWNSPGFLAAVKAVRGGF
jgi:hypothetical protein